MKYAFVFSVFGCGLVAAAALATPQPWALLTGAVGLAFALVGFGYAGVGPRVFLKRSDGRLPLLSHALFWPYFALNHASLWLYRRGTGATPHDELAPGVFLGARLRTHDVPGLLERDVRAVLDLTAEFGELTALRDPLEYRCIPLLDATAPSDAELDDGVAWMEEQCRRGAVYVHCALGHGRSATFVAAYLVAAGIVESADAAEERIAELRPRAGLNEPQRLALHRFVDRLRPSRISP